MREIMEKFNFLPFLNKRPVAFEKISFHKSR